MDSLEAGNLFYILFTYTLSDLQTRPFYLSTKFISISSIHILYNNGILQGASIFIEHCCESDGVYSLLRVLFFYLSIFVYRTHKQQNKNLIIMIQKFYTDIQVA